MKHYFTTIPNFVILNFFKEMCGYRLAVLVDIQPFFHVIVCCLYVALNNVIVTFIIWKLLDDGLEYGGV